MAKAITTTNPGRNSATADRSKSADQSPFRSKSEKKRIKAAREMVKKRSEELARLEALLAHKNDAQQRRVLQQQATATRRNLDSWLDYLTGQNEMDEIAYREPRAVIIP